MHSCLYKGRVSHRRFTPKTHTFSYPIFYLYLDLDELDQVFAGRRLWSTRRAAPARFCRSDHAGPEDEPLKEYILTQVKQHTGRKLCGPVRLLTQLRYFSYVFNPVSFYYCFDKGGERIEAVVAEVNNTPWGEQHLYVLPWPDGRDNNGHPRFELSKAFHVSPFMPMDILYRWRLSVPTRRLGIFMENYRAGEKIFQASLTLAKRPINSANCARVLINYPLMTVKIILAIHWQALRLLLKGVPLFSHPRKNPNSQGGADTAKTL